MSDLGDGPTHDHDDELDPCGFTEEELANAPQVELAGPEDDD